MNDVGASVWYVPRGFGHSGAPLPWLPCTIPMRGALFDFYEQICQRQSQDKLARKSVHHSFIRLPNEDSVPVGDDL